MTDIKREAALFADIINLVTQDGKYYGDAEVYDALCQALAYFLSQDHDVRDEQVHVMARGIVEEITDRVSLWRQQMARMTVPVTAAPPLDAGRGETIFEGVLKSTAMGYSAIWKPSLH
jgi:hypothetical protein